MTTLWPRRCATSRVMSTVSPVIQIILYEVVPSQFLSELNPDDPICGCETYIWNSAQCSTDEFSNNYLEIGIGDGIRPGRAPPDFEDSPQNTGPGYLDAPWLESESNPDGEDPYKFPLDKTALVVVDFQRDFVCPGGFSDTPGNNIEDSQKPFSLQEIS